MPPHLPLLTHLSCPSRLPPVASTTTRATSSRPCCACCTPAWPPPAAASTTTKRRGSGEPVEGARVCAHAAVHTPRAPQAALPHIHSIRSLTRHVEPCPGYVPGAYTTRRLWATAPDGVRVPISLLYRTDLVKLDGSDPLLFDGYGRRERSMRAQARVWHLHAHARAASHLAARLPPHASRPSLPLPVAATASRTTPTFRPSACRSSTEASSAPSATCGAAPSWGSAGTRLASSCRQAWSVLESLKSRGDTASVGVASEPDC